MALSVIADCCGSSRQEHDHEKACPGLDPGVDAVFGQDHAQTEEGAKV
jgi:hypothetical protein